MQKMQNAFRKMKIKTKNEKRKMQNEYRINEPMSYKEIK